MAAKKTKSDLVVFRPTKEITQMLKDAVKATDRPKSYIIKKALEMYLEDYTDYQIAVDRFNDPSDKIITWKEMESRLKNAK